MNNCKYLKQKLNRSFECKRTKKTININECSNCKFKEYKNNNQINIRNKTKEKIATKETKNTFSSNKKYKCTKIKDNCAKIKKTKQIPVYQKYPKKSSKIAKLEKSRYSVFTDNLENCIICGNKKDHLHEIFFGNKRQKSMEMGFVIPLCFSCHAEMHINKEWQDYWHKQGQLYFEKNIGSRDEFINTFGKSYL